MSSLRYQQLRPRHRTRPFSLYDIKNDVVVSAIARMEIRRHLQIQANKEIKETLMGGKEEQEKGSSLRLKFSRAPTRSPVSRVASPAKPVRKSLSCRTSPRPMRTCSQGTLQPKWVSPFDRRDIVVLPKTARAPDLTLVASQIPSYSARNSPMVRRSPISDGTQTSSRLHHIILPKAASDTSNLEALGKRLRTVLMAQGTLY